MQRVVLIGAWGYGNAGDDAYLDVWRHYFPDVTWIVCNSDLPEVFPAADLYLYGGGGILFDNGTAHFEYMQAYADYAEKAGIPIAFCSVGIQTRANTDDYTEWYVDEALARWSNILRKATFITVRDPKSQALLLERNISAQAAPDVCHLILGLEPKNDHFLTVIPGPGCGKVFRDFRSALETKLAEYPDVPLIIMNTGAPDSDYMVDELSSVYPTMATFKSAQTSVDLVLSVIRNSLYVMTGRYHGLVFARAAGKPFWRAATMRTFKMYAEALAREPFEAALHLQVMSDFLGIPHKNPTLSAG